MIIESGVIVFLGLCGLFVKLPPRARLLCLGKPLHMDLGITVGTYLLHMGTFSGVMSAAVAGLLCSGFISLGRYLFGYIEKNTYYPGRIHIDPTKLRKHSTKGANHAAP